MSWVAVGLTVAGAVSGKMKNDHAKEVEGEQRQLAAQTQRYSPWTGLQAGKIDRAGSEFGDVFGGGVQGAMVGGAFKKAGTFDGFGGGSGDPTSTWADLQTPGAVQSMNGPMAGDPSEQLDLRNAIGRNYNPTRPA